MLAALTDILKTSVAQNNNSLFLAHLISNVGQAVLLGDCLFWDSFSGGVLASLLSLLLAGRIGERRNGYKR